MVATRYDSGKLRKAYKTPEGALFSEAIFARDGVLEYRLPNGGKRLELRLPETNYDEDTLISYGSKPVTIEHPSVLVTADNAKTYQVGASDAEPVYERRYDKGFVGGVVRIWHQDGVDAVERNGKKEVSIGYTCDIEPVGGIYYPRTGTYVVSDAAPDKGGERFDAIQRNVRVNHIALTSKGRAGPEVCLRIDSEDDDVAILTKPFEFRKDEFVIPDLPEPSPTKRMATIRIDNMDFGDVPETVAVLMNQKLNLITDLQARRDALEIQVQEREEQLDEFREQVEELADERDRERGRADALEIQLAEAQSNYDAAPASSYKGKKKGKAPVVEVDEDEEDDEDDIDEVGDEEDDEDEDDEDMEPEPLPKKKGKRKDSVDPRSLFAAFADANSLVPGLITEDKFDSIQTPTDVRRLVVESLNPSIDLVGRSDAYIDGVYDYLKTQGIENQEQSERNDSIQATSYVGSHTPPSELSTAIAQSRTASTSASPLQGAVQKQRELYMNNWNKPLDLV